MFGTWDTYRGRDEGWGSDARKVQRSDNPLSSFLTKVDLLLYVATGGLAICLIALLLG